MTQEQKTVIEIKTNQKFKPLRVVSVILMMTSPICLGIATGSSAMQWAGFVLGGISVVAAAAAFGRTNTGLTIEQARARLDEIEQDEISAKEGK